MTEEFTRARALAYRIAAHGLGDGPAPGAQAVLELGVQDTPAGSARHALAERGADDRGLTLAWSLRGAPHLHHLGRLPRLGAALWPLNDADARARLLWTTSRHEVMKVDALSAFRLAAGALAATVTRPMPRGEASAAVTALLPEELSEWCARCKSTHVSETLFRQAMLLAGVGLERADRELLLLPLPGWSGSEPDLAATAELALTYLRLLGPAGPIEVAAFLGTAANPLATAWPSELADVRVAGRRAFLPPDRLELLRCAPEPKGVRLLPPSDPYLQARDRTLLLGSRSRRSALWRPLASPGAVLIDGEIAGTWRTRSTAKAGFEVLITPFDPLPAHAQEGIEEAGRRIAGLRGEPEVAVRVEPDA
jgi:hypothetical protein